MDHNASVCTALNDGIVFLKTKEQMQRSTKMRHW